MIAALGGDPNGTATQELHHPSFLVEERRSVVGATAGIVSHMSNLMLENDRPAAQHFMQSGPRHGSEEGSTPRRGAEYPPAICPSDPVIGHRRAEAEVPMAQAFHRGFPVGPCHAAGGASRVAKLSL